VRAVTSVDEFLRAPVGAYIAGKWYIVWVASPSLIGTSYFGRPTADDFPSLVRLFDLLEHAALAPKYDVLADAAAVEGVPDNAFDFLIGYLAVAKESAPRMRRVAIVRPLGMVGATLAGVFYEIVREQFHAALFGGRAEAARWLAHPRADEACAELDRLVSEIRELPVELARVQRYLETRLHRPELRAAARDLGLSTRSLQRGLQRANTSFREQVERARMRAAERLLLDGSEKIETVARSVGYSRLTHFATAFRRVMGETPSQFRARRAEPVVQSQRA
jgi:AraC-like DNA-binding protein